MSTGYSRWTGLLAALSSLGHEASSKRVALAGSSADVGVSLVGGGSGVDLSSEDAQPVFVIVLVGPRPSELGFR